MTPPCGTPRRQPKKEDSCQGDAYIDCESNECGEHEELETVNCRIAAKHELARAVVVLGASTIATFSVAAAVRRDSPPDGQASAGHIDWFHLSKLRTSQVLGWMQVSKQIAPYHTNWKNVS